MTKKCLNWLNDNIKNSPRLVYDLEDIKRNYFNFLKYFEKVKPYYAVKANPNKNILKLLSKLGSNFDCASIKEIIDCKKLNINSAKLSFGNTIKKSSDIKKAYNLGINLFAFDCDAELEKIAKNAPGTKVYCRIQVPNGGAEWPLSKKFGCTPNLAEKLLIKAKYLALKPIGISFHVGSQQLSINTWKKAIIISSIIFQNMNKKNLKLYFLNIGGGMPSDYKSGKNDIEKYGKNIISLLKDKFKNFLPREIIAEPGRYLVASSGVLECEVILIKKIGLSSIKWIYLDVGRYNGLAETEGEAIKYNIEAKDYQKAKKIKYILAGPSCDGHDVLYKKNYYHLPKDLKIGDKIRIYPAGAYTTAYQTDFNGIKKIKQIFID